MTDSDPRNMNTSHKYRPQTVLMQDIQKNADGRMGSGSPSARTVSDLDVLNFLQAFTSEVDSAISVSSPNPFLNMTVFLIRSHAEGRVVTSSTLIAASDVPYATGRRKL